MDNSVLSFLDEDLNPVKPEIKLKKNTIILDIDECLINSTMPYNNTYMTSGPHDLFVVEKLNYIVFRRPYLDKFLRSLFEKYNVGFWTTGTKDYAMEIIKKILLNEEMDAVKFILARENPKINKSHNKGRKVPLNKFDKAHYKYWKHDKNPNLSVGYIDVLKNKKFNIKIFDDIRNFLVKDLDYVFQHPEYSKFCNKNNTILIDDNPNHYQVNNGNNIIAIQPWSHNVWCDDKLNVLMDWLIKHHDKNLGKCKLPNLLDRTLPEMYNKGKGSNKLNTQIIENHCQEKVKSKNKTQTKKISKSGKSVKKANNTKKTTSSKKIVKKTKKKT